MSEWPLFEKSPFNFNFFFVWCKVYSVAKRSWRAKTADCNPSIVLWGRNFKPYKKFLPYFIFINLLAQEVRICSELWLMSYIENNVLVVSMFFQFFWKKTLEKMKWKRRFFVNFCSYFIVFSKKVAYTSQCIKN